ncbi:octopamine receptor 1 [Nematostella vectensis]|uniref:octopamine receptor 1 n=1 Tax=Nematostella vectensis TaxID=45351 RepID=UPI0020770584|nr:octopamine receptor 1 [Nematostella vectensis]
MTGVMVESVANSTLRVYYSKEASIVQATSLAVIMMVAVIGNTLNIIIVYRNYSMQTPRYLFIINMACGDLGVALLSMPFSLIASISRDWVLGSSFCQLHGFLGSFFFCVSIFTLTIMSIEQYYALVRPLSRAITIRRAWGMMFAVWALSAVISIEPIFGWGHFDYNSSTLSCGVAFPRRLSERLYLFLLVMIAFVTPLFIMGYAYIRIFVAVQKHTTRIAKYTSGGLEVIRLQRRITFTLLLVLFVFLFCWSPFVTLIALANQTSNVSHLPYGLGVAAYWCGFFNSSINPIIFVIRNERFREGYVEMLGAVWESLRCCLCKAPVWLKPKRFRRTWYLRQSIRHSGPPVALGSVNEPHELINEEP